MIRIIAATASLCCMATAWSDDPQSKSTRQEGKYLNLVDESQAFQIAKKMNKRIFVYQDWPL